MLPRLRIASLPTPIEAMPRLSAALKGPRLWIKRDDLTGVALGGNKIRKLEYLLAEASANGARTLVTVGAIQSNHCRQTAALAARLGYKCILVLSGEPPQKRSGNLLLDHLLDAEIIWTTAAERQAALQKAFEDSWSAGERPYLIPLGGSTPVGAAAYAFAFEELLGQDVRPDWIVFASSSGGTQAGLVLGARRAGWPGKILGISVDESAEVLRPRVAALAGEAADRMGEKLTFDPQAILVNDDYCHAGYAVMGEAEKEAIGLFARYEGQLLDPVYTGRAAAGLIDLIRKGAFREDETVLFWHTGGTPALFAETYVTLLNE